MKKFYFALAAVAAILAGCTKEVDTIKPEPVTPGEKAVSLKASVGDPETKVSSDNAGIFNWQDSDKITVLTNNGNVRQFTIGEITDGTSAEFSGTIPDVLGETIKYALYPASTSHFSDGTDNILFSIDDQVIWDADASNMPMLAKVGGSASFKAVGGVLKLVLFNIPDDADYLKFSATNKQISGDFEIADASITAPVIATAAKKDNNNEQVIDFSANYSSSKVFYIPLPTGTIDGFTVALYENLGDEPLYTVTATKSLAVTANILIIAPAMNCAKATVLWSEDFSGFSNGDVPSGEQESGVTYACTNGTGNGSTKVYGSDDTAGGVAPELLVCKNSGTFTVTGIPTNDATSMVLKFKKNAQSLTVSTTSSVELDGDTSTSTAGEKTVTLTNNGGLSSFDLTFTGPSNDKNVRLDDISVYIPGKSFTAPTITTDDDELNIVVGSLVASTDVALNNPVDGLGISCLIAYPDENKWIESVDIDNGTLTVTAKAANSTNSNYSATVTLKASGAASKAITVTQESALVPNPANLTALAGNATVDITWTGNANASSYVAYLHTAPAEHPETGGTDISSSISHDGQAYIIDDYSVDNDQTYYVYVKVNGVAAGYVAPTDYVVASFTPEAAKGTAENPYTVAEAIVNTPASGTSDDVYIRGFVSAFYGSNTDIITDSYHRYYISDDGTTTTQLLVFNGKGLNNIAFSSADDLTVGDEVTILGGLTTYNSTKEVAANNYIVSRSIKCATPVFSPAQGTYYTTQNVTITTSTADATIYYTTDGTEPTTGSTLYSEPIAVSADLTIKAIAVKENFVTSAVAEAAYDIEAATKLGAPTIAVDSFNHNSITFSWEAIEHATGYRVSIDGGENWLEKQEELTYTWTGLEANTSYTVKVKAIGTDNGQYTDSDAASKSQTTTAPKTLVSIALTTPPTTTTYNVNGTFSLAGAVVTATYSDETTADVTASCETVYDFSTTGNKTVTISYTESDITRTCECNVTVAIVDVLTNSTTGISGTAYTAWSGKSKTSGSGINSDAVYAGQSAGGDNTSGACIQLRSKNSDSGIVTTTSGGNVSKITVTWNDATADDRSLDIYGKNSAYSAATELYNNSNQGTKLGSIVKGTSTELTIDGDYEFVGLRSSNGAMYIDEIRIQWAEGNPSIAMAKTSISGVAAAGVNNASESGVYTFKNGATDADVTVTCDGEIVTAASKNNGAITYTVAANTGAAREGWIKVQYGSEDPHTVTVSQLAPTFTLTLSSGGNGTVSATVDDAAVASGNPVAVGKTVSITTTPSGGYELESLSYNDGSAHDITSTKSFTMPAHAVTVTATFSAIAIPTISMNKTSISDVAAAGVNNASESGVYSFLNGATDADVTVTCDGTVVTAASKNNGAITYTVAANNSAARNGWIKVQYGSEDPHTVTVSQLAGAVEPTEDTITSGTFSGDANSLAMTTAAGVTITQLKGSGTNCNTTYNTVSTLRVYRANQMRFTGKTFTKVEMYYTSTYSGASWSVVAGGGTVTIDTTNKKVVWENNSGASTVTLQNSTTSGTNTQLRTTKFIVYY